jgi:hypothetical protein
VAGAAAVVEPFDDSASGFINDGFSKKASTIASDRYKRRPVVRVSEWLILKHRELRGLQCFTGANTALPTNFVQLDHQIGCRPRIDFPEACDYRWYTQGQKRARQADDSFASIILTQRGMASG